MPRPNTPNRRAATIAMYVIFAALFVVVAAYTALHLIFYGFSGQVVAIDLAAGLLLPLVWILGLLRTIALRARPRTSLVWGYTVIVVLVVALTIDTVRFGPLFAA